MKFWIQCLPEGDPIFCTASPSKLRSRQLLIINLYRDENITWNDIRKKEKIRERFFQLIELEETYYDDIEGKN